MNNATRTEYLTRDHILKLLSDREIASVSTAETAARLVEGDEYLDLEQLQRGVQRAGTTTATPMGRVLPRKSVKEHTWVEILKQLTPGVG